jgi:nitrite reductase/ring-hydroxylating ferredoxin subunit/Fe-S cluster biogenesis protein NfuA
MVAELAPTIRDGLDGLLGDIERLEAVFAGWDERQKSAISAYRLALEALHGEALRRLVRALKRDPAALTAMRGAVTDEVVYAVLRRHQIIRASVAERVEAALAGVRPMLASHGGDVELVSVEPPRVALRFTGACDGCAASAMTFHAGVKTAIEDACPEITEIVQLKGLSLDGSSGSSGGAGHHADPSSGGDAAAMISPFALARRGSWHFASMLSELPDGGARGLEIAGTAILLARHGDSVTCFENACAHLGMPIDDGEIEAGIIACPHHGFRYDLRSGECLSAPSVQLAPLGSRVVGGRVEVKVEERR